MSERLLHTYFYMVGRKKVCDYLAIELYRSPRGYFIRFRDLKTGRFIRTSEALSRIYRKTLVVRPIPVHNKYYGARLTTISCLDTLKEKERELEDMLVEFIEEWLGYPESEWWFAMSIEEELTPVGEINWRPIELYNSINEIHLAIENEEGMIVHEEWERLEVE